MSVSQDTFVIVGAGLAGATAAEGLRQHGFDGRIVMVGDEHEHPYERPPLSKDYLRAKIGRDAVFVHPPEWYGQHDIELRLGTAAVHLDVLGHRVVTSRGESIRYERALIATGSSPRRLPVPGATLPGVHYLRRIGDADALKAGFASAGRVVIVGAGWIGLEAAAAARAAGVEVTVVEVADLPLLGVLGPKLAAAYANLHRRNGVDLRCRAEVASIRERGGRAAGIELADGTAIDGDLVIVGVGVTPNTTLAETAGLGIANGILVDEYLTSSNPDVFAAGDVANAYYPHLRTHVRLEHWAAALHQGPVAAANMLDIPTAYDRVPYFYSDQYDWDMEYSGYLPGGLADDVVIRGDLADGRFIAFWLVDGRVRAGMNVNVQGVTDAIQDLIRTEHAVGRFLLADATVSLTELRD